MTGITAYGGYIPRLRLNREAIVAANAWANPALKSHATGERAMCNWDEDAITMAVEAARDCLGAREREGFTALVLASTSAPFDDRQNAGIVAQALRLAGAINTMDVAASQRAGTSGLIAALDTAASRGPVLFVAAEKRHAPAGGLPELQSGDGAASLILEPGDGIARLIGSRSASVDFVDHYRGHGSEFDYGWEERWIRDEGYLKIVPPVLAALLAETATPPRPLTHFCLPRLLPPVP